MVVQQLLQLDVGRLVFKLVPFLFKVLFQKVAIADPARLSRELKVVFQEMAMLPQETSAEVLVGRDRPTVATEERRYVSSIGLMRIVWMEEPTLSSDPRQEVRTARPVDDEFAVLEKRSTED